MPANDRDMKLVARFRVSFNVEVWRDKDINTQQDMMKFMESLFRGWQYDSMITKVKTSDLEVKKL